jgi:hypothetical protein
LHFLYFSIMLPRMRSCILAIVIFAHLIVGFEVASDIKDVWLDAGAPLVVDIVDSLDNDGGESLDSDNCDHCCHGASHLVAFSTVMPAASFFGRSDSGHEFAASFYTRAGAAPPTPPPNA